MIIIKVVVLFIFGSYVIEEVGLRGAQWHEGRLWQENCLLDLNPPLSLGYLGE